MLSSKLFTFFFHSSIRHITKISCVWCIMAGCVIIKEIKMDNKSILWLQYLLAFIGILIRKIYTAEIRFFSVLDSIFSLLLLSVKLWQCDMRKILFMFLSFIGNPRTLSTWPFFFLVLVSSHIKYSLHAIPSFPIDIISCKDKNLVTVVKYLHARLIF